MSTVETREYPYSAPYADAACITVEGACRLLSIGKTTFYEIADQLDTFTIGRRRLVTVESIRRLIAQGVDAERRGPAGHRAL